MPLWEWTQILLGLAIPYLLLVHIVNTRGTRILTGIDINYPYEIANLWVTPWNRFCQIALVLLVWGHFAAGLHFWLRNRSWHRRGFSLVLNHRLSAKLSEPLAIGIGIHTGQAIVGRVGPPKTPVLTALGDAVNTAARLESASKELHAPVVVSRQTLQAARLTTVSAGHDLRCRGRSNTVPVCAFDLEGLRDFWRSRRQLESHFRVAQIPLLETSFVFSTGRPNLKLFDRRVMCLSCRHGMFLAINPRTIRFDRSLSIHETTTLSSPCCCSSFFAANSSRPKPLADPNSR